MSATMHPQDMHLKRMSPNGKAVVTEHRVWDAPRFLASAQQAAANAEKDPAQRDTIMQASRQEYLDFRNLGK